MKETIVKTNKTKSLLFEKIKKIDKPLARLIKKKRIKLTVRNEKGEVITDNAEIQRIIRKKLRNINTWRLKNIF